MFYTVLWMPQTLLVFVVILLTITHLNVTYCTDTCILNLLKVFWANLSQIFVVWKFKEGS